MGLALYLSIFCVSILFFAPITYSVSSNGVTVDIVSSVSNAYVLKSGTNALIIDIGSDVDSVYSLSNLTESYTLDTVYITHSHPDHWGGFGGIDVFTTVFPSLSFTVATESIRDDLLYYASLLGVSTSLLPNITVLQNSSVIPWVVPLEVYYSFPPAEAPHTSLVYQPTSNLLFSGDVIYCHSHLYLGQSLNITDIQNWIQILNQVKIQFYDSGEPGSPTLHCGHGYAVNTSTDGSYFNQTIDDDIYYLNNFVSLLCTNNTALGLGPNFPYNISNVLEEQFPDWVGTFALGYLIDNPNWVAYINATCPQLLISTPSPGPTASRSPTPSGGASELWSWTVAKDYLIN